MSDASVPETAARAFTITRVFDAPRELVFAAWTNPEHLAQWWGPHGVTTPLSTISADVRPGGTWRATMIRDDNGRRYPMGGEYIEVSPPERLVFTWGDAEDMDDPAGASVVTVDLADLGGKTRMRFHQAGFSVTEERENVRDGWSEAFERLGRVVER